MRNYDLEFLKKFSMVIGLLVLITLGLIVFAAYLQRAIPDEVAPSAAKRTEQRIAPAGRCTPAAPGPRRELRPTLPPWPRPPRRWPMAAPPTAR